MNPTISIGNWRGNAIEAVRQVPGILGSFTNNFSKKSPAQKAGRIIFGAVILGACAASVFLPAPAAIVSGGWFVAAQMMGLGYYGLSLLSPHMKENRHKLAFQPIVAALGVPHKILLGGFGYAIMGGIGSARAFALSCIPEDRTKLRRGIALGFWGAGIAAVAGVALFTSPWNFLPIASMTLGTWADTVKSENTRYARLMRTVANANNAFYSLVYSRSVSTTITDASAEYSGGIAVVRMDVPKSATTTRTLFGHRFLYYLSHMARFKSMPEFYPQPATENGQQNASPSLHRLEEKSVTSIVSSMPVTENKPAPKISSGNVGQLYNDPPSRPRSQRSKPGEPPIS